MTSTTPLQLSTTTPTTWTSTTIRTRPGAGSGTNLHEPSNETIHGRRRNLLELTLPRLKKNGIVASAIATLAAASLAVVAAPASSSGSPLNITYISSLTGPGASEYGNSQQGCAARVDLQNAEGGVNGRKVNLSVVDDETNPTLTSTAVQGAVSNGALGIVANSPLFYLAANMLKRPACPSLATPLMDQSGESSPTPTCSMRSGEREPVNP